MVLEVLWALARRWYVVIVGLLLTGGLTYGALITSPPEYHARGLVLLLPSDAAVGKGGNPFLQLSGLEQPAGILVASFSSAPAREAVGQRSPTADYTVGIDDSTRGPVIAVDVTAASERETMDTLTYLVARIPAELSRLQTQVEAPADTAIRSMALTVDTKAEVSRAGMIRMAIAALVMGMVATGAAGYAVDALIQRRRLRVAEAGQDSSAETGPEPDTDESRSGRSGHGSRRGALRGRKARRAATASTPSAGSPADHDEAVGTGSDDPRGVHSDEPFVAEGDESLGTDSDQPLDVPLSSSSERQPVGRGR